jgi:hypothetical protein
VAAAALCYFALAVLVTFRLWAHPSGTIVGGNPYDADQSAWFLRYAATAVAHFHLPALTTTALNAPDGIGLMWNPSIPLPALVLAPLTLVAGPQVSLTLLMTCGFAGSALSMFCVLRSWGVRTAAAAIAGFGYGFSPAITHSALGHYDLQFAVLPPLIVSAAFRLLTNTWRHTAVRTGIWLGVLVAAQLFIDEEMVMEIALALIIAVVVLALSRPREVVAHARQAVSGIAAAVGALVVVASYGLWTQFFGRIHGTGTIYLVDWYKNDLGTFIEPSSLEFFHTSGSAAFAARFQGQPAEYLGYIGVPALVVMTVLAMACWRVLAVRVMAVLFVLLSLLSLGPTLMVNGHDYLWLKLPWYWVETKPLFGSAVVDRFSIIADGAAMAVLAFGLRATENVEWPRLRAALDWRRGTGGLAALAVAVLPLMPRPLASSPVTPLPPGWAATFAWLHLPPGAPVLVLPAPSATNTDAMRWQADTGEPASLYGGYFIGPAWNGILYVDGDGLAAPITTLNQIWSDPYTGGPAPQPPRRADLLAQLVSWHPAAIVAVTSPVSSLARYLDSVLGQPTTVTSTVLSWRRLLARRARTLGPHPRP